MSDLNLEVGKLYERADGTRARIRDDGGPVPYVMCDTTGHRYPSNGKGLLRRDSHEDLIREVYESLPDHFQVEMPECEHLCKALRVHMQNHGVKWQFSGAYEFVEIKNGGYHDTLNDPFPRTPILTPLEILAIPIPVPVINVTLDGEELTLTDEQARKVREIVGGKI